MNIGGRIAGILAAAVCLSGSMWFFLADANVPAEPQTTRVISVNGTVVSINRGAATMSIAGSAGRPGTSFFISASTVYAKVQPANMGILTIGMRIMGQSAHRIKHRAGAVNVVSILIEPPEVQKVRFIGIKGVEGDITHLPPDLAIGYPGTSPVQIITNVKTKVGMLVQAKPTDVAPGDKVTATGLQTKYSFVAAEVTIESP